MPRLHKLGTEQKCLCAVIIIKQVAFKSPPLVSLIPNLFSWETVPIRRSRFSVS